jgi:hypothetical protein
MMTDGKLVWHRNPRTGVWYTHSADERYLYMISKVTRGLWGVACHEVLDHGIRWGYSLDAESLGERSTMLLCKRLADEHHHAYIREHGSMHDYEYIRRYPLVVVP